MEQPGMGWSAKGVIYLKRTQNFPKNNFLPPGTHTCVCVRNVSFSENFAYVLNEWS